MRAAKVVLVALAMATSVVVGAASAPAQGDEAPQARTVWCC